MSPVRLPRLSFAGKRCPACGYNLRGSRTGQCPECGTLYSARPRARRADLDNLRAILRRMWFKTAIVVAVVHFVAVIALWLYMFTGIGAAKPSPRALAAGSVLGILVFPVPLLSSLLWGAAAGTAWVTLRVVLAFGRRVLFRRPA